jgi:hypothetical protein
VTIALSDVMLATLGNLGYLADFEFGRIQTNSREELSNCLVALMRDLPLGDLP